MTGEVIFRQPMRIRRTAPSFFLAVLVAGLTNPAAFGWGCDGHQTVAAIAFKHLDANVRSKALEVLQRLPANPPLQHYCKNSELNLFVDVSTWADDIRVQRPETAPWH
jgi:hypothetical protein